MRVTTRRRVLTVRVAQYLASADTLRLSVELEIVPAIAMRKHNVDRMPLKENRIAL